MKPTVRYRPAADRSEPCPWELASPTPPCLGSERESAPCGARLWFPPRAPAFPPRRLSDTRQAREWSGRKSQVPCPQDALPARPWIPRARPG